MPSTLVKLLGFPATLIHGDPFVIDRWRWLKAHLPQTRDGEKLLDVGCGSGAFTIGSALRGYAALGLSWDERNQRVASERASICGATSAKFEVFDVRKLSNRTEWKGTFETIICFENIEHILDDLKLMRSMSECLKPGGRLLLTAPNFFYRPLTKDDIGLSSNVEDGGHVRRGYSPSMLRELCEKSGLMCDEVDYVSGYLSQKLCGLQRFFSSMHPAIGWLAILPLRILPILFDEWISRLIRWPGYSICLVAFKPRY